MRSNMSIGGSGSCALPGPNNSPRAQASRSSYSNCSRRSVIGCPAFSLAINAFRIRGFPNTDQGPSKERGPRARKTAWPILAFDPRPFCQARASLNIAVGEAFILYFAGNRTPPINQMRRPRLPLEKPYGDIANLLRGAGLRPTQQRLALAHLLFANGNRHVTAEALHEEALARKVPVSLATVYNTLHQFTEAGLLREVAVEGAKTYFDTNTSNHYHFFCEHSGQWRDSATGEMRLGGLPKAGGGRTPPRVAGRVGLVKKPPSYFFQGRKKIGGNRRCGSAGVMH